MEPTCILRERSPNHRPTGSVAKRRSPDHPADDDGDDCAAAAAAAMMMMIAAGERGQRRLVPQRVCPTKSWPRAVAFPTTATSATAATAAGTARSPAAAAAVASFVDVAAAGCSRRSQRYLRLDTDAALGDPPADICSYDTLFWFSKKSKREEKKRKRINKDAD